MSNLYNSTVAYDSTVYEYNGDLNQPIAGLPIVGVFFAPDNGPYDDNPNWIEITNYVRAASINRGRSNDYEQFRTATASITLDNRDRLFDPFNTAGTYYGKLTPRTPIKLVAQANGFNYTLFRGYVSGFPVEWTDNGYDSTVTVDCYDLLGLLAQTELPTDWSYQVINSLSPVIWYRFDDTADATEIRNYVDSSLPLVPTAGKPLDKHPSLAPGLQTGSWEYTAVSAITVPPDYTGRHSVAWWVRNTRAFASFGAQLVVYDKNFNMEVSFIYNSAIPANSYISFYVQDYGQGVIYTFRPPLEYYKDSAMHIVVVEADSGAPTLYINGRAVETTLLSTGTTPSPTLNIRRVQVFEGRFQEVAVFQRQLSSDQVALLYGASAYGYEETTAARANRLVDTTLLPDAFIDITDTPVASVAEFGPTGNLLPELYRIADSEGGEVFVSRDGVLQFVDRWYAFGSPTSAVVQATFGETDIQYSDTFTLRYDSDNIRNSVRVEYTGDATVTETDDASVAAYGLNAYTLDTRLSDSLAASSLATLEVTTGAVLRPTVGAIRVGTIRDMVEWATVLNLDVLHRIRVKRTPSVGSAFQQDMLINSITYSIEPDRWSVSIEGSARLVGWFTSDYSLTDGSDVVL